MPCGEWPDLRLARNAFVDMMDVDEGKRAIADKGYADANYFIYPNNAQGVDAAKQKRIMARHETVNRRLKQFGVLSQKFRYPLYRHPRYFRCVVILTQIMLESGEELYPVVEF